MLGATGVFTQLQDALNTVWDVDPKKSSAGGFWGMLKDRLLSFSMVCGLAFLLLVSLAASALMSGLSEALREWLPDSVGLLWIGDVVLSAALTFLLFAMIFKFLPDVDLKWSDVWVGAGITTVLFIVGKYAIGLYLGQVAVGSAFGAAGSFVVLLTWLYYSSLILLFGAEFTQVYATRQGTRSDAANCHKPMPIQRIRRPKRPAATSRVQTLTASWHTHCIRVVTPTTDQFLWGRALFQGTDGFPFDCNTCSGPASLRGACHERATD